MSHAAYADGMMPFPTKKALREAVATGVPVTITDCAFVRPAPDVLVRDGETDPRRAGTYYVEGPDPLGGVPNRWYARVTIDTQGKVQVT